MKLTRLSIAAFLLGGLLFASCKKGDDSTTVSVSAGPAQVINLLTSPDSLTLTGIITGGGTADMKYAWTEVSGPDTFSIPKNTFPIVTMYNLDTGKYVFQFLATNSWGSTATSKTTVTVIP